jgi:hypothetical protein
MVHILERNGVYVKKIRTDKPGYVIYEDEWQLVAEPFRKGHNALVLIGLAHAFGRIRAQLT